MLLALVRGYDDDLRAAEALLRQAIAEAAGDTELLASARNQLAGILFRLRERLREAAEHATAASASARVETAAEAIGSKLMAEAALGDPQARATLRRVHGVRRAVPPPARHGPSAVHHGVGMAVVG